MRIKTSNPACFALTFLAAAMAFCVSCSKDNSAQIADNAGNGPIEVVINGKLGGFGQVTKSTAVSMLRMKWSEGDIVWAYGMLNSKISPLGSLSVSIEDGNYYTAVMRGTLSSAPSDGRLYLVYSSLLSKTVQPGLSGNALTVDMSSQSSDVTPFVAYAIVEGVGTAAGYATEGLVAGFNFATSVVKVNAAEISAGTQLVSALITGMETDCKLKIDPATGQFISGNDGSVGTIVKTLSGTTSLPRASFYVGVPCISASSSGRFLSIAAGGNVVYYASDVVPEACDKNQYVEYVYDMKKVVNAVSGPYSVADGKKVFFSRGNLQATWSTSDSAYGWAFAEHQHDYIGGKKSESSSETETGNNTIDSQADGAVVDLFGWVGGSSETLCDAATEFGISTSKTASDYGIAAADALKADWGTAIDGDGNWSTLTKDEWKYLLDTRTVNGGKGAWHSYLAASINTDTKKISGLIIFPDGYRGQGNSSNITSAEWQALEKDGCVFLPAAGYRSGSFLNSVATDGYYWSSTASSASEAFTLSFYSGTVNPSYSISRSCGRSVRLVHTIL